MVQAPQVVSPAMPAPDGFTSSVAVAPSSHIAARSLELPRRLQAQTAALLATGAAALGLVQRVRRRRRQNARSRGIVLLDQASRCPSVACAAGANYGAIRAAVQVGKDIEQMKRKRMSVQDKQKLRMMEVSRKVAVLRGRTSERVRKYKEEAKKSRWRKTRSNDEEDEEGEEGEEADDGEEGDDGKPAAKKESFTQKVFREAQPSWAFKRDDPTTKYKSLVREDVSDDARAVAASELSGNGGKAAAQTIMDASFEFECIEEWDKAIDLLEIARSRLDTQQLERTIDLKTATALEEEILWRLAAAFDGDGRLTMACDTYSALKERLSGSERFEAERLWAQAALDLGEKLYNARRFDDSLEVLENLREQANILVVGDGLIEEVKMYTAMALHGVKRTEEAKTILKEVISRTLNRKHKAQASFVLDVISVDMKGFRNEEFHKVWDATFKVPEETGSMGIRIGGRGALDLNLSPSERAFRTWASEYWEERLKSPLYYAFLTLWVTWPFAIPVVSILKKMQ